MNAHELFHAGKLREAVAAATEGVKQHPSDSSRRFLLAELLCFSGDLERADNHLDAISHNDPQSIAAIHVFRQLIRAEQARQQFYAEGRLPTFLGKPEGPVLLMLEASILIREGKFAEASALLEQVEEQRPKVSGVCDNAPFHDFRDLDDLNSCVFEVLTVKGDYYWVPVDRVESIEFREPLRPRDLFWRNTHLIVRDGPDAEVFIPVLYPRAAVEDDDLARLGRLTDWRGGDGAPVRGVGQRTFLIGEETRSILELHDLSFGDEEPPA